MLLCSVLLHVTMQCIVTCYYAVYCYMLLCSVFLLVTMQCIFTCYYAVYCYMLVCNKLNVLFVLFCSVICIIHIHMYRLKFMSLTVWYNKVTVTHENGSRGLCKFAYILA